MSRKTTVIIQHAGSQHSLSVDRKLNSAVFCGLIQNLKIVCAAFAIGAFCHVDLPRIDCQMAQRLQLFSSHAPQ
nr:MAG TPA: hypothetical protein [Caudoviricetes sp.]